MSAIADSQRPYLTYMPQPPELEALPTAGSLVGRHLIVREISRGTIGPLFLARTQNENEAVDTLARVLPIPPDLPSKDDQLIAEAIWDSANVGHDMVLRVADVVAGKGWVTLIHDHQPGSMLSAMHWRASDVGNAFPSEVAARIALDVLDGLEQSRSLCESNGVPWRCGAIAIGSLYLCGDGRTRALDGQVMAAVMRSARMRAIAGTSAGLPPEMLDEGRDLDQRADVFTVGALLWQLLTGRELSTDSATLSDSVSRCAPQGTSIPQGLESAVQQALELDRDKRQSTLRELAVALVMGAEKVATYQQVVDFAGTLMPFEMAFRTKVVELTSDAARTVEPSTTQETTSTQTAPAPHPVAVASASASADANESSDSDRAVAPAMPIGEAGREPSTTEGKASSDCKPQEGVASATTNVASPATGPTAKGAVAQLEQIDWPDDDAAVPVEPFKKSNGKSAFQTPLPAANVQTAEGQGQSPDEPATAAKRSGVDRARLVDISPVLELKPELVSAKQQQPEPARTARRESPKTARRDSARPTTHPSTSAHSTAQSTPRASSRPAASKPVQATVPTAKDDAAEVPAARKNSNGLQISATTLILGFSTTVLAVILIMILLQQKPGPSAPPLNTVTSQFAVAASVAPQPEPLEAKPAPTQNPVASATSAALSAPGKTVHELQGANNEPRVERPKRASKASTKGGREDGAPENAKTSKKPGQFVPDEI